MSIEGNAQAAQKISGKLSKPDVIHGKSAYELAVMHGFDGTEEEWLASLKGEKGDPGGNYDSALGVISETLGKYNMRITDLENKSLTGGGGSTARIGYVDLLADSWQGEDNLYSQIVTIEGVTANSQVDLTPSAEQLAAFHSKDLTFVTKNANGVVTVYAIGQKPQNDYTIQVTITEVVR